MTEKAMQTAQGEVSLTRSPSRFAGLLRFLPRFHFKFDMGYQSGFSSPNLKGDQKTSEEKGCGSSRL